MITAKERTGKFYSENKSDTHFCRNGNRLCKIQKTSEPLQSMQGYRLVDISFYASNEILHDAWISDSCTMYELIDYARALGYLRQDCRLSHIGVVHRSRLLGNGSRISDVDIVRGERLLVFSRFPDADSTSITTLIGRGYSFESALQLLRYTSNDFDEAEKLIGNALHPRSIRDNLLRNGSYLHHIAGQMGCYNRLSTEEFLGSLLLNPKSFESEIASMRFDDCCKGQFYHGPLFHTFVHLRRLYHKLKPNAVNNIAERLLDEYELSQAEAHYRNGENHLKSLSQFDDVAKIAGEVRVSADLGFWPSFILYAWCLEIAVDPCDACEIRHYINLADMERRNINQYPYVQYLYNHLLAWHGKERSRYPTMNPVELENERESCLQISRCSPAKRTTPSAPRIESWLDSIMKLLSFDKSLPTDQIAMRRLMVKRLLVCFRAVCANFDSDTDKLNWIAQHCAEQVRQRTPAGYLAYGLCWFFGIGVREYKVRAARYFKMSAEYNFPEGQYLCGMIHINGDGVDRDLKEAAKYLKLSADQGFVMAQFRYGVCLRKGEGVAVNLPEAARYFKMSAERGHEGSMYNYAIFLQNGIGVSRNIFEAVRLLKITADKGMVQAQCAYGLLLYKGQGVFPNVPEALRYFKLAADKGYADGQYHCGQCLYSGGRGVPRNLPEAVRYWKMSADQGHPQAQYNYGVCLINGQGVPRNVAEAVRYYKMSADNGCAEAQYNYGACCYDGDVVPRNVTEAARYWKMSADQGDVESQYQYGYLALNGEGIPQNRDEAISYLKMAAGQGHRKAKSLLDAATAFPIPMPGVKIFIE